MNPTIPYPGGVIAVPAFGYGWLAVEKPAGMSVHNDPGADLVSIVGAAECLPSEIRPEAAFGVAAVHRLDRDTSGLLLLACRREVFAHFAEQFETHRVEKRYLALLHGHLEEAPGGKGAWRRPLTPKAAGRRQPAGSGPRVPCETRFRVLEKSRRYTLAACTPVTGRQHQIRRHAKLAGHPVVGDRRYGSKRAAAYLATHHHFTRLALHAERLTVIPPEGNAPLTIGSAGLPEEIRRLMAFDRPS